MAGFCHVWWRGDAIVTEPDNRLRNFPYAVDPANAVGQLNARAISLAAEWGACPVLTAVARVFLNGDGLMRWNTWAAEAFSRAGVAYTVDRKGFMHVKALPLSRYIREPSADARALVADINPNWSIERQLYVEEHLTADNAVELLGF